MLNVKLVDKCATITKDDMNLVTVHGRANVLDQQTGRIINLVQAGKAIISDWEDSTANLFVFRERVKGKLLEFFIVAEWSGRDHWTLWEVE